MDGDEKIAWEFSKKVVTEENSRLTLKGWFRKKLTIQEAETENMITDERLGPEPIPFGFCNGEWKQLVAQVQPGDEIWSYRSPEITWRTLCGRAGMVLVRNGEIVAEVVTCVN